MLGTVSATDDDDAGGDVLESDSGIGDVPVLPSWPAGPEGGDAALFFKVVEGHDNSESRSQNPESRRKLWLVIGN